MIYSKSTYQTLEDWRKHYRSILKNPNSTPQMKEMAREELFKLCEDENGR